MNQAQNYEYWQKRAIDEQFNDKSVTYNDIHLRDLEISTIMQYLNSTQTVLDVGCGGGYGTFQFASKVKKIVGWDYSENMIYRACQNYSAPNIEYYNKNIVHDISEANFDVVITQRCLINIMSESDQYLAIQNIYDKLRTGGIYLMLENTQQGRNNLNDIREVIGLPRMPPVSFNLDFDEYHLAEKLKQIGFKTDLDRRFGVYDFGSRVLYPLAADEPQYDSRLNAGLSKLLQTVLNKKGDESFPELSRTFLKVLRK